MHINMQYTLSICPMRCIRCTCHLFYSAFTSTYYDLLVISLMQSWFTLKMFFMSLFPLTAVCQVNTLNPLKVASHSRFLIVDVLCKESCQLFICLLHRHFLILLILMFLLWGSMMTLLLMIMIKTFHIFFLKIHSVIKQLINAINFCSHTLWYCGTKYIQ